jgi:hypothetical protein
MPLITLNRSPENEKVKAYYERKGKQVQQYNSIMDVQLSMKKKEKTEK